MRYRTALLTIAMSGLVLGALWHHSGRTPASEQDTSLGTSLLQSSSVVHASPPATQDSLSERESLRRIEQLYRLQADLAQAQAARNAERIESTLQTAIRDLGTLVNRPGLTHRPRFRQVFRVMTSEYERRYGVPDTLRLPQGDIYELRSGLSLSLRHRDSTFIGDVLPTDLREQHLPVPLAMNEPVKETIAFLLQHKEAYLYPWLRRAATYFPMIEQIFAEEGIPDELKYLALAESGLDPYAQSRAQAAGIWQFVAKTGRRYDLSIDPWVDERLDPEKSTRAAAQHLRDLYEKFGDWQLALAGYNCDPGVVQYQIYKYRQRTGRDPSFWAIYDDLPEETRNYVPLYTATAIIISNPTAFDLKRVRAGPRYAFDAVPVNVPLSLDQVARLANVELDQIRTLNPELRSNRLPPSEEPYYVRLPYGTYSTFSANYTSLSDNQRNQNIHHVLQSGETGGQVAERYHVDRSALLQANDVAAPIEMEVGERLTIPQKSYNGNARLAKSADRKPLRIQYGSRTVRRLSTASSQSALEAPEPAPVSARR